MYKILLEYMVDSNHREFVSMRLLQFLIHSYTINGCMFLCNHVSMLFYSSDTNTANDTGFKVLEFVPYCANEYAKEKVKKNTTNHGRY